MLDSLKKLFGRRPEPRMTISVTETPAPETPHPSITLKSGIIISLVRLNQYRTYEGLIEGIPTKEMNDRLIDAALEAAKEPNRRNAKLLPPIYRKIELSRPYPFGDPVSLPRVTCIGRWQSPFGQRGAFDGWGEMTLVWYQDDFALPIDPTIITAISELNWERDSDFIEL